MGPSRPAGDLNYIDAHIENIIIMVNGFPLEGGPSMCGINFIKTSHSYINEVQVITDTFDIAAMPQPVNKVFGIGLGFLYDDFPRIGRAMVYGGFYYGFVLGEGVHAQNITAMRCYIGLMCLSQAHAIQIDFASFHWNTYTISSQDDVIYDLTVYKSMVKINSASIEKDEAPEWSHLDKMVLDSGNNLYGMMFCNCNTTLPVTKTGGRNFFLIDQAKQGVVFDWTTTTRPTVPIKGCTGWNETSGKYEMYNGSDWVDLN
jgi:hypothetical protein